MNRYKYIILFILLSVVVPAASVLAQDAESDADTAIVQSELDIQYDSILSKAASSLSALAYDDAIAYYKEAAVLKPAEIYPYKMINYVEDIAAKQRRADELKRKAKIKDALIKADKAIVAQKWDTAKVLFSEILTLQPEKTDQEYAKSKIEAINLELQRIAARVPPPPKPVVVVVPKNRREARAMRKMAERNVKVGPVSAITAPPQQTQVAASTSQTALPPVTKAAPQKPAIDTTSRNKSVASAPAPKQTPPPAAVSTVKKTVVANNTVKETQQKPATDTITRNFDLIAGPVAKEAVQKPVTTLVAQNNPLVVSAPKETIQTPAATSASQNNSSVVPTPKEAVQKPVTASVTQTGSPEVSAQQVSQQKPATDSSPNKNTSMAASVPTAMPPATETQQKAAVTQTQTNTTTATANAPVTTQTATTRSEIAAPEKSVSVNSVQKIQTPASGTTAPANTSVSVPATKTPSVNTTTTSLPRQTSAVPSAKTNSVRTGSTQPARTNTSLSTQTTAPAAATNDSPTPFAETSKSFADSSDQVKLICQDISFIGSNAYVKVLIQNYSSTESFLTDTLQVSIKKNNGTLRKLDQRFISSFPTITPLKELVFVSFADASIGVEPDDIFILEMRNRLKKTKLAVQIPWSLYQQQKNL